MAPCCRPRRGGTARGLFVMRLGDVDDFPSRLNARRTAFEHGGGFLRASLDLRRASGSQVRVGEAASELGRFAARVGGFAEARELLAEAHAIFTAADDEVELLLADTSLVECQVLEGRSDAALELCADALRRFEQSSGVSILGAMLYRWRGWAHLQLGDLAAAQAALEQSLAIARAEGENLGMRNADYEIALTLDALAQLRELGGETADELAAERDAILARLTVVEISRPPLPH